MVFLILFTLFFLFTLINSLFFHSSKLLLFLHSFLLSTKTPTPHLKKQSLPHPPNLNTLFSTVDADFLRRLGLHDFDTDLKSLDIEEFKELLLSEEEEEEIREAFEVFDENGDGMISVEELGFVLKSLGMREGDCVENCREMINRVDLDGDGMVDFQEFKRMMVSDGE